MFIEADAGVRPWQPAAVARGRARARGRAAARVMRAIEPYLYLLPALLCVGIWVYRPLVEVARLSFLQWDLIPTTPQVPVGISNFTSVLTLPELGQALKNTAIYVLGLLPFSIILPAAIALLIADIGGRSRGAYRSIIFVPVLMAPVVVAIIWERILAPAGGITNAMLATVFHVGPISFLSGTRSAIWTIVGITAWKQIGFAVLLFSAGIASISHDYMEAARMDGATALQIVRDITLPLLSPTIMFLVLLTVLLSAQWTFPLINVLTQGGPVGSTTNIYFLLYKFGFENFNIGYSAASAVIFFVAFGALALVCIRLIERFSFYDA
jgi:multiple sugar transport system permease protein